MQKVFGMNQGLFAFFCKESFMTITELNDCLERSPVISAVQDNLWDEALKSPSEVIFYLKANISTLQKKVQEAHDLGKYIFVHIDLAEGIGKDKAGVEFLYSCGVDGVISTRNQMIKLAREFNMLTVQRFFALDSQGLESMHELFEISKPDMAEIMPGVISKIIKRLSNGSKPVIAGGLIETKAEVTDAITSGAIAVSTGNKELWYI